MHEHIPIEILICMTRYLAHTLLLLYGVDTLIYAIHNCTITASLS